MTTVGIKHLMESDNTAFIILKQLAKNLSRLNFTWKSSNFVRYVNETKTMPHCRHIVRSLYLRRVREKPTDPFNENESKQQTERVTIKLSHQTKCKALNTAIKMARDSNGRKITYV